MTIPSISMSQANKEKKGIDLMLPNVKLFTICHNTNVNCFKKLKRPTNLHREAYSGKKLMTLIGARKKTVQVHYCRSSHQLYM